MACCVCFFLQGSKTWIALLVPVVALFARFSSFHGTLLISIPLSVLVLSTFCLLRQKVENNSLILPKNPIPDEREQLPPQEPGKAVKGGNKETGEGKKASMEGNGRNFLVRSSENLYSESDRCSSTSSEDHSSDTEWPYNNMRQEEEEGSVDCSDDSLSDEESLFEIAIPSGLSLKEYPKFITHKCCQQESLMPQKDFLADINEDNLIEIDIKMGSIKCCPSF